MNIKAIRNDAGLQEVLKRLEPVFQAEAGTPEHEVSESPASVAAENAKSEDDLYSINNFSL